MANIEIITNASTLDEMGSTFNETGRRIFGEAVSGIKKEGALPYYLTSIYEHLPPQARKDPRKVGWNRGMRASEGGVGGGSAP